eukprot:12900959-Prorocentrum_lima.AAC.1
MQWRERSEGGERRKHARENLSLLGRASASNQPTSRRGRRPAPRNDRMAEAWRLSRTSRSQ